MDKTGWGPDRGLDKMRVNLWVGGIATFQEWLALGLYSQGEL